MTGRVDRLELDIAHRHSFAVRDIPMRMGNLKDFSGVVRRHEKRRAGPRCQRASARGEVGVDMRLEHEANASSVFVGPVEVDVNVSSRIDDGDFRAVRGADNVGILSQSFVFYSFQQHNMSSLPGRFGGFRV